MYVRFALCSVLFAKVAQEVDHRLAHLFLCLGVVHLVICIGDKQRAQGVAFQHGRVPLDLLDLVHGRGHIFAGSVVQRTLFRRSA